MVFQIPNLSAHIPAQSMFDGSFPFRLKLKPSRICRGLGSGFPPLPDDRQGPPLPLRPSFLCSFLSWGTLVSEGQDSATRCSRVVSSAPPQRQCGHKATCSMGALVLVWEARGPRSEMGTSRGAAALPEPAGTMPPAQDKNGPGGLLTAWLAPQESPESEQAPPLCAPVGALVKTAQPLRGRGGQPLPREQGHGGTRGVHSWGGAHAASRVFPAGGHSGRVSPSGRAGARRGASARPQPPFQERGSEGQMSRELATREQRDSTLSVAVGPARTLLGVPGMGCVLPSSCLHGPF